MPGMYFETDFDLTAFARGAVEKADLLPRKADITEGDVAIGLLSPSLNLHTLQVVKHLMAKQNLDYSSPAPFDASVTLEEVLLAPRNIYVQSVLPLARKGLVKAASYTHHGGVMKSVKEILPDGHNLVLDPSRWKLPAVFSWVADKVQLTQRELFRDYNCGVDMILVVNKSVADEVLRHIKDSGKDAAVIGDIGLCGEGKVFSFLDSTK